MIGGRLTLAQRLQAAMARQRAASARHDVLGVRLARDQVAALRALIAARSA